MAALALALGSPAVAAPERPPAAPDPSPSSPGAPTTAGSSGTDGLEPSDGAGTADPEPQPTGPDPDSPTVAPTTAPTSAPEVEPEPSPDPEPGEGASETLDPLEVSIESLEPSVLPDSGEVTLRGSVTNRSPDLWTELAVYAATSATSITTAEQLREAESGPPGVEPVDYQRIVEPGLFELVGDLGPGESTDFTVRLPRSRLGIPRTPGVYRLGVQVLGTEPQGRIDGADGRDRLLTVVAPRTGPRTPLSVALQLRRRTTRTPTGEVDDPAGWERVLSAEGRLRHLLGLLASARQYPVDAVVDPAVVEAVGSIAAGNPSFDLTAQELPGVQQAVTQDPEPDESPDATESPEEPESPGESGSSQDESDTPSESDSAAAVATQWLRRLARVSDRLAVGALPYGDLDLEAAVHQGRPGLVGESLSSGISLLSELGIQATGLLAPLDGVLVEPAALAAPQGVPALVGDDSLVQAVVGPDGVQVLDTPAGEVPAALEGVSGAPLWTYRSLRSPRGAESDDDALALRQRILARSAVSALTRPGAPLVAVLPPQWQPGTGWRKAQFFAGLRQADWLDPRRLDEVEPRGPKAVTADSGDSLQAEPTSALALRAASDPSVREVPGAVFGAADGVVRTGEILGDLVVDGARLASVVSRQAMLGRSVHSRGRTPATVGRLQATDNVLGALVRDVEVQAPRFVRMSSEEGSFLVPVVNQLDVAVQVQLQPRVAEPGLTLAVPEPVVVGPGARRPIRVEATSRTIGIRSVQLDLATASGLRLYPGPSLAIRSSQVARWVWVAMAIGSGILFLTILVRIVRRIRHRSQPVPTSVSGPAPDPEEAR